MIITSWGLFKKENYKNAAKSIKDPKLVIAALRKQYYGLTKSQLSKYQTAAKANKQKIDARKAVIKQAEMTTFALFVQRNFAKVAKAINAKGKKTVPLTVKALGKRWSALNKAGKASYVAAAQRIRKAALPKRNIMVAKYSA